MNTILSHTYPHSMIEEMNVLVELGIFPSKNAIARAGVRRILEENKETVKAKKQAQTATCKRE